MTPQDGHYPKQQPVEGSRDVIDRELARNAKSKTPGGGNPKQPSCSDDVGLPERARSADRIRTGAAAPLPARRD